MQVIKSKFSTVKAAISAILTIGAIIGFALSLLTGSRDSLRDPGLPVMGIDVSSHNGDIDFDTIAGQGFIFTIIKATEGSTFKDPAFHINYKRAKRAGLKIGAYHFFRFETSGQMQAINLLNSVRGRHLDFPLIIDIEEWGNPYSRPTDDIVDRLSEMISCINAAGYPVMLYTNKDGLARFISGRFDDIPLWICSFTLPQADTPWTLWQFTHRGELDGIKGKVDIDAFAGSADQFDLWLKSNSPATQY